MKLTFELDEHLKIFYNRAIPKAGILSICVLGLQAIGLIGKQPSELLAVNVRNKNPKKKGFKKLTLEVETACSNPLLYRYKVAELSGYAFTISSSEAIAYLFKALKDQNLTLWIKKYE